MNRTAGDDVIDTVVLPATPSRRPVLGEGPASDPTVPGISEVHTSAEARVPADICVAPEIHVPAPPAAPSAESVAPAARAASAAQAERPTTAGSATPIVKSHRARTARVRAWMLVPPVDALMIALPILWAPQHTKALLATAALTVLLLTNGRCYRARLHLSVLDELPLLTARIAVAVAIVATVTALRHEQDAVTGFLVVSLSVYGLFIGGRVLTTQIILWARRRGHVSHRTLVIGGGPTAAEIITMIERYPRYGLSVVGFVDDANVNDLRGRPWLGPLDHLEQVVMSRRPNAVIVADGAFAEPTLIEILRRHAVPRVELFVVPRLHDVHNHAGAADHIGSIPVLRLNSAVLEGPAWGVKRALDIVMSGIAVLLLWPVLAVCAIAVRIEGGPGILFRQERVGRDGTVFECLKFRSMKPVDSAESATNWSIANDSRVGPVGRILRRTSLDELPQLFNILRGDMTLVGPRPERPHFVDKFSAEIPGYGDRLRVRAGLTGLAQVSGLRGDTPIADRARFDNYYIENWSLWMDVKVILRTFGEVLFARGR